MLKYEAELCYAWQETEEGVYHAFELVDAVGPVDFDAVAEKLAGLLDTTTDDERFNWDSMCVKLPGTVVDRIANMLIDNSIKKALADWRPELNHIIETLGTEELLAQLAEEAAELGKAALKLRRALNGKNPTPVSPAEALLNVQEEMADVLLCVLSVGLDEQSAERTIRSKIPRWAGRIDHDPDSDCPKEDTGFHDDVGGYHEGGCGWDPNGHFCGECSESTCANCGAWRYISQKGGAEHGKKNADC